MKRLTRSQYEVVAGSMNKVISLARSHNMVPDFAEAIAMQIAKDLSEHDNQFDKQKFLQLCGIED